MEELAIRTKHRQEFVDITREIEKLVISSGVKEGVCFVFCSHTTAGLTINENADPAVRKDIINHLEKIVPYGKGYSHLEGNSDAHIKASLMGSSLNILVEGGRLLLGTWQGVYFCEFDGPRIRKVYAGIIREGNLL